ncbi:hypothetical protein N658DRAFT_426888 [Parathielavia hyrcaniae]|uniref:C2H2-type domain-containing protein n=1 Tax=Parathielavia hyrcaniae TaxID=113614 RepID=A0AAN6Q318_9PEZI|nr:hypothetical protein N658DRAFT_426888 [Parathielavia hyrcaniae]
MASYPPPPAQNAGRGNTYPIMSNSAYPQQPYPGASSSMMPPTTTAASHPQPIAPAPPTAGGRAAPVLRPMPAGGVMSQPGMSSPYGQSPLMAQAPMMAEGDPPTHVVGSQGRRGILPSAPGRPPAPAPGSAQAKNQVPQKDADGKFPCPHCTKTYLHAKHLKRHLLRHSGDRPYMCVLCHDTFSRSDILKRHFIKCSVRRGNPTGASHLSHPQAHVKKNAAAQQKPMGAEGDVNHMNGMGNMPADGMVHPFGIIPASDGMSNVASDQSQLSRSSSINRAADDANRDRRSMTASVMASSTRPGNFDQPYNGGEVANNMTANINPQLANYSMPQNQNGMPMFGGSGSTDWSQMFQAGAQSTYVNTIPSNAGQGQMQTVIKPEPNPASTRAVGIPGDTSTDSILFPSWGVPSSYPSPYHQLSTRILDFLRSSFPATDAASTFLDFYFHSDNVRVFLENYTHLHAHLSILHIPTFRAMETHVGLLAAMCCVGACYSELIPATNIREVMDCLKAALEGSSRMFASLVQGGSEAVYDWANFGSNKTDLEELQAIMLTQILFTWHGTPVQRDKARKTFPLIASSARKAGLLRLSTNGSLYSMIHQPDFSPASFPISQFSWHAWVAQEKRIRTMYMIFVYDVALGLYFNTGPEFDPFEIRLPLPADDAAWDASDIGECAEALGLRGPDTAKLRNPDGSRRSSQPEMHLVLRALLDSNYHIQPGSTNLFGKFILIHALLAIMRRAQLEGGSAILNRSSTPVPARAWFVGAQGSPGTSGRVTPVDLGGNLLDGRTAKALMTALDKFKSNWDHDMATQFPPSPAVNPRRYGFTRDGIHFYWLATCLLKSTRTTDLQMAPDQRFAYIIHLLKSVKRWVLTDGASRGEELGSVGDIDAAYGAKDVTLDMTQLFRPLPTSRKSPGFATARTASMLGQQ